MNRNALRTALVVTASLVALPALAAEPTWDLPSDWPVIAQPRPARVLHAQPTGAPSSFSADPTWPVETSPMPAITYAARTNPAPVFDPPVDAHQVAMKAARATPAAAPAQLAAK